MPQPEIDDLTLARARRGDRRAQETVLRRFVRPVHAVVKVDLFVPGCPPSADTIYYFLSEVLAGRTPDISNMTRFGK